MTTYTSPTPTAPSWIKRNWWWLAILAILMISCCCIVLITFVGFTIYRPASPLSVTTLPMPTQFAPQGNTEFPEPACPLQQGQTSKDPTLIANAIRKLQLPGVTTPEQLLAFYHITEKSVNDLEVDHDCTSLQLPSNGTVFSACNPTDFTYDGFRYAWQSSGITLTGQNQIGFPTGQWDLEGLTLFPKPNGQPFVIVQGACQ